jgi:hypothetical protein
MWESTVLRKRHRRPGEVNGQVGIGKVDEGVRRIVYQADRSQAHSHPRSLQQQFMDGRIADPGA